MRVEETSRHPTQRKTHILGNGGGALKAPLLGGAKILYLPRALNNRQKNYAAINYARMHRHTWKGKASPGRPLAPPPDPASTSSSLSTTNSFALPMTTSMMASR